MRRIRSNSLARLRAETPACRRQARRREGEAAGVAKLEYARDLGSRGRKTVRVRVPPSAPLNKEEMRYSNIQKLNAPAAGAESSKQLFALNIEP